MDSPQLSRLYEMAKRLRLLTLNGRLESLLQEAAEKELLGHSQSAVTLDTYSHMLPSLQREAVESLDRLLVM